MSAKAMKQVENPEDVPFGKHYAVIEFRKLTESSGWGSENDYQTLAPRYYVTEDENVWKEYILTLESSTKSYGKIPYVALVVASKAQIKIEVKID